jgi:thioester reductase-like protein
LGSTKTHLNNSSALSGPDVVFVTGAGGVIGQALIRRFTRQVFLCLAHKNPVNAADVVTGDVCLSQLGMSSDTYDSVAENIDCVIHSAAITDFGMPADDIMAVNVDGTQRVLELAAKAGVPFYHISTAYIHSHSEGEPTPYELSKIRAEELVRKSGIPATIIRPSVILGDAVTGEISSFQGFHFLIGLYLRGLLPFLPALPDSYIDFVPQDFVADAIMALIRQNRIGEEIWLTAGTHALRIDDIVDCCIHEIPPLGRPLDRPNMISRDTYERLFRPAFFHSLPKRQKRLMDRAMTMVKYLNTVDALPSNSPDLEISLNISPMPDPRATLRSSLFYWARHHRMLPSAAQIGEP